MISMVNVLAEIPSIDIDARLAERVKMGYQPAVEVLRGYLIPFLAAADVVKLTIAGHRLVAVAEMLCSSEELKYQDGRKQAAKVMRVFDD